MLHIQVSITESVTVVTDVTVLEGGGAYQKRAIKWAVRIAQKNSFCVSREGANNNRNRFIIMNPKALITPKRS